MPKANDLPSIDAAVQKQTITFDFGFFLPAGVTLTGTPTIGIEVVSGECDGGTDNDPNSRLFGPALIGTNPLPDGSGIASASVMQQVGNLQPKVTYKVTCVCDRSDGDIASTSTKFFSLPL